MQRMGLIALLLFVATLTACDTIQSTGDRASDPESAQNQLPNFAQYTATDAANIKDAFARAMQLGSLGTGNVISALMIERLNTIADCLGNVGAVAGRVYTGINPPAVGVLAVINNQRLTSNFLPCMVNPGAQAQTEGRQAVEPCAKAGSYTDPNNGVGYSYIYAASDPSVCASFDGWLATKQQN